MALADIYSMDAKLDPSIGKLNFYHRLYEYNDNQSSNLDAEPNFGS